MGIIEVELKQLEETFRMQTRNFSTTNGPGQLLRTTLSNSFLPRGAKKSVPATGRKTLQKKEDSYLQDGNGYLGNSRKRLLHALEARRTILQKEQGMSFARAFAAGFDITHVKDLLLFSNCFGATRLREACLQFTRLYKFRKESNICAESMPLTMPPIESASSFTAGLSISCNSCKNNDDSGSRMEDGHEGYEKPLNSELHPRNENEISFRHAMKTHHLNQSTGDEDHEGHNFSPWDEDGKIYTGKILHLVSGEERCFVEGAEHKERVTTSVIISDAPCTSNHFSCHCCHCANQGSQSDCKVSTSVCKASCNRDMANCQSLLESELLSSNLSNRMTSGEPLHELTSSSSRYGPACMQVNERFTIQVNNLFDQKCLSSHYFNHNTAKTKESLHVCCLSNEECIDRARRQSIYDHETVPSLIVINNQIFSASHSTDFSTKNHEEIEGIKECCEEQIRGDESNPSRLSAPDIVPLFEKNYDRDEQNIGDMCNKRDNTNFESPREVTFGRVCAGFGDMGEICQKSNDNPETAKSYKRELSDCCSHKTESLKMQGTMVVEAQSPDSLKALKVNEMEPLELNRTKGMGAKCSENLNPPNIYTEEGSQNPSTHKGNSLPHKIWMEYFQEKLSESLSANQRTNAVSSHYNSSVDSHMPVFPTIGEASISQELMSNASKPSEERVTRFLKRYYEKREEKLRNRFNAEREKSSTLKSAPQQLDEDSCAKSGSNDAPQSMQFSITNRCNIQSQKIKEKTTNFKVCKEEEHQKHTKGLHAGQHFRSNIGASVADCRPARSQLSIQDQKSHTQFLPGKRPAARKVSGVQLVHSVQKQAPESMQGSQKTCVSLISPGNTLNNAVTSLNKIKSKRGGTSNIQSRTSSWAAVDNRRMKNSQHFVSMTPKVSADKDTKDAREISTKHSGPSVNAPSIRNQGKPLVTKAKAASLLTNTNKGAKEVCKNFLRKGTGHSSIRGGVTARQFATKRAVGTMFKEASLINSPQLLSDAKAAGQQGQTDPQKRFLLNEAKSVRGMPTAPSIARTGLASVASKYERAAKRASVKKLKREDCDSITTMVPEGSMPLVLSSNMQLNHCVQAHEINQSGECLTGAACLEDEIHVTSFSLAKESRDSLCNKVISSTCDPLEIPVVQEDVFAELPFLAQDSSGNHFSLGPDGMKPSTNIKKLRSEGDVSRITPFLEHQVSTNNQRKDLKRFLKFGWRSTQPMTGSDGASASLVAEEDDSAGRFSEPMPKILDCYGKRKHAIAKALNLRVGLDMHQCPSSTFEHNESKGYKVSKAADSETLLQELLPLFALIH